jgi:hypothetical protein
VGVERIDCAAQGRRSDSSSGSNVDATYSMPAVAEAESCGSSVSTPITSQHTDRVMAPPLRFELRFPPTEIRPLAARFGPDDDARLLAIGAAARARGHYTRSEFIDVCAWKTPRSRPRIAANTRRSITARTARALSAREEADRIAPLLELEGVGVPTASTLLYFAFPGDYPILDVRALESLGVRSRSTYTISFWLQYLDACRAMARANGVSIRTLDKALWQHSKERSAPGWDAA